MLQEFCTGTVLLVCETVDRCHAFLVDISMHEVISRSRWIQGSEDGLQACGASHHDFKRLVPLVIFGLHEPHRQEVALRLLDECVAQLQRDRYVRLPSL